MPEGGDMLNGGSQLGEAAATSGLWMAVMGGILLLLVGVIAAFAGMRAGFWIILVGAVCVMGASAALYFRKK
ncbi:hypothetical protein ACIBQ3_03185 [Streptomyces rubiginosohelvolus]|uniref:hypothetical protein n=1 Tax=Streptomyces rubiginosohelvolus TaxID=67362 RepID=UPI003787FCD0